MMCISAKLSYNEAKLLTVIPAAKVAGIFISVQSVKSSAGCAGGRGFSAEKPRSGGMKGMASVSNGKE